MSKVLTLLGFLDPVDGTAARVVAGGVVAVAATTVVFSQQSALR